MAPPPTCNCLPVAYEHSPGGWRSGAGDIELSAKYRFFHDETAGVALTRSFGEHLLMGLEADHQGADTEGGSGATSLGWGPAIW